MKQCFSSQLCCQDCTYLNHILLIIKQLSPWNRHFSYSTWNLRSDILNTPCSHLLSKTLLPTPGKFSDEVFSGKREMKITSSDRFGCRHPPLDTNTNSIKVLVHQCPLSFIPSHISHQNKSCNNSFINKFFSFSNTPGTAHTFLWTFQNMGAAQESNDCTWGCFGMPSRERGDRGGRENHSKMSAHLSAQYHSSHVKTVAFPTAFSVQGGIWRN